MEPGSNPETNINQTVKNKTAPTEQQQALNAEQKMAAEIRTSEGSSAPQNQVAPNDQNVTMQEPSAAPAEPIQAQQPTQVEALPSQANTTPAESVPAAE